MFQQLNWHEAVRSVPAGRGHIDKSNALEEVEASVFLTREGLTTHDPDVVDAKLNRSPS